MFVVWLHCENHNLFFFFYFLAMHSSAKPRGFLNNVFSLRRSIIFSTYKGTPFPSADHKHLTSEASAQKWVFTRLEGEEKLKSEKSLVFKAARQMGKK